MGLLLRGLAAGSIATAVEIVLTDGERRLLGPAPYEPSLMVQRFASSSGYPIGRGSADMLGAAMQLIYGPAWGLPASFIADRMPWPIAAVALGSIVVGFEFVALPLTRATPPIRNWPQRFVIANFLHSFAFAAVATGLAAHRRRRARRMRSAAAA